MQRSSGSAGQPAHHSENSSAARPAGGPHNGKGKDGKGKDCKGNFFVSAKDVFSKVFLDRFPESANHKQQGRAHFQEDGAMTQALIIKAWKKPSLSM